MPPRPLAPPMDQQGMRTLFLGLMGGFLLYGASYTPRYFMPEPQATYWSLGLNLVSVTFTVAWFIAVRRGFRLGRSPNRGARRAKEHARAEKEKKQRMFR